MRRSSLCLSLVLGVAALAGGCGVDNGLGVKDAGPVGFDTGDDPLPDTDTDTAPPPPEEECNGLDDDGDGAIDEGFPDSDGDGIADCLDPACPPLDLGEAGPVDVAESCEGTATVPPEVTDDPWDVQVKWAFSGLDEDPLVATALSTPVVGPLADTDGDGRVDEHDTPTVVVVAWSGGDGWVVAIDGATGAQLWSYAGVGRFGGVVIADVDADGLPDVVAADERGRPLALEGDGTLKWQSAVDGSGALHRTMLVADLDEDGRPEVLNDNSVYDGATGAFLWSMGASSGACNYAVAAVGDIDLADGDQEVLYCGAAYDSDGTLLWDSHASGGYGFFPAIVQADADPEAEIVWIGARLSMWNADGTPVFEVDYPAVTKHPGPPCVGDFDGDGTSELAFPTYDVMLMYELDGTLRWSVPMTDFSGIAGCSAYDLNADGALEVLQADEQAFRIRDGATGAPLYEDYDHLSLTEFEYPTVADLDGDGFTEVLVVNDDDAVSGTVTAYEHAGSGWPAAGASWCTHDFAMTTSNADCTVPAHPEPSWERYNVYRAKVQPGDPVRPDLTVSITDVCVADCTTGPVQVALQVVNRGGRSASPGRPLALYALGDAGAELVKVITLPGLPAASAARGMQIDLTVDEVGSRGFRAVVDDDGTGASTLLECDETNNVDEWWDVFCP